MRQIKNHLLKKRNICNTGFDIPFHMRRAMNSQLLILLQICSLLILLPTSKVMVVRADGVIARRGCKDSCGNVSIPFPFGIGPGCFLDHWFKIECNSSGSTVKAVLSEFDIEVMEINKDYYNVYRTPTLVVRIPPVKLCAAETQAQQQWSIDLGGSPYNYSSHNNVFMMEGCPGSAVLVNESKMIMAGCGTVCKNNNTAMPTNSCYGIRCCQTFLPREYGSWRYSLLQSYQVDFNLQLSGEREDCLVATLIKSDSVNQYAGKLSGSLVPVVLHWSWISSLQADNTTPAYCFRSPDGPDDNSLFCECLDNSCGNAYVSNGCQVIEECKGCRSGYCRPQWDDEGRPINAYKCEEELNLAAILGVSISFGVVASVTGLYGIYRFIKRRKEMKRRAKFFKRNGGLLLQQQLSSNEGVLDKTKIFSISELDKATDHFNDNRILGQGGQGTVYKGMLIDGKIVAIKKAQMLDESQLEQFINEVVILSQINHRNVVRMLGCCLETEVPLLVYEFIPNGTLSQHIHDPDEDFVISWEMRLKIAADSASAIAYLHSSSSIPIYHRDIKSSNILLDEKHRARVSDFGSSKTVAIDQTHLTTLVQGTLGYLDPEYFQSYQYTDKSDVYSFGVVLLEILTSKNPIYRDATTMEQKNLVTEFLFQMKNSGLSNILDPKIVKDAKAEELSAIVELAKCCISWSGKLRPTMKEVAMTLEMINKSPAQALAWHQQAFPIPDEGCTENAMMVASDEEFMSHPLVGGAALYTDIQPLLPNTI